MCPSDGTSTPRACQPQTDASSTSPPARRTGNVNDLEEKHRSLRVMLQNMSVVIRIGGLHEMWGCKKSATGGATIVPRAH